ncbi:uncharacterized protein [Macrobrachium rosenbergii]|uniref:uncharacterized protein n=1 Tax=Macrobrachium rosenbergii TaxID=79674 RepID=UPI0034D6E5D1
MIAQDLGLIINKEKSQIEPSQTILYLGIVLDSARFRASPSQERQIKCLEKVQYFLGRQKCSAREWMSLLGTLSSLEKFVSLGRLHLRPLQHFLSRIWDRKNQEDSFSFDIPAEIKKHLSWWLNPSILGEGISLRRKNPDLVLFSDASESGWGATLGNKEVSGSWEEGQIGWHINRKELMAIWLGLKAFKESVAGKVVEVNSDNTTALAYISKQGGTRSLPLYETARELLLWTKDHRVELL